MKAIKVGQMWIHEQEVVAKVLIKGKRYSQLNKSLLDGIYFRVLGTTKDVDYARQIEDLHLSNSANNSLCLNIFKKSTYNKRVFTTQIK